VFKNWREAMAAKKSIPLDNYENGLLILAITKVLSCGHDFSTDDVMKLKELKAKLQ
jgi:hypothetical protein